MISHEAAASRTTARLKRQGKQCDCDCSGACPDHTRTFLAVQRLERIRQKRANRVRL